MPASDLMDPKFQVAVLLLTAGALAVAAVFAKRRGRACDFASIPSPKRHWLFGNLLQLRKALRDKTVPDLMFRWYRECGPLHLVWIGRRPELVVSSAAMIKAVLLDGQRDGSFLRGGPIYRAYAKVYGSHLGNLEGEEWKWRREEWQHLATPKRFEAAVPVLVAAARRLSEAIEEKSRAGAVTVDPLVSEFHMRILAYLVLGIPPYSDRHPSSPLRLDFDAVYTALAVLERNVARRSLPGGDLLALLPTRANRELRRAKTRLHEELSPWVAASQLSALALGKNPSPEELLQIPMLTALARHPRYTAHDLETDLRAVLFPRTTGHALSFLLGELASNRLARERARSEVVSVLGRSRDGSSFARAASHEMPYLEAIFKETMRLHSVIPFISLKTTRAVTLGGRAIPADTVVRLQLITAGYDPEMYTEPESFIPERWLETRSRGPSESQPMLLSFSLGKHGCFAFPLAVLEAKVLLSVLLANFDWEHGEAGPSNTGVRLDQTVAVFPATEMPLRISPLA